MTTEERDEIRNIQAGDQLGLERFLTKKKPLINLVSRAYFFKGGDESDLAEEATIGLFTALMSFDLDKNDNFDGYAITIMKRRIINAVKSYNRKKHSSLNDAAPMTITTADGVEIEHLPLSEDPVDRYVLEEEHRNFYAAAKKVLTETEFEILSAYLGGYSYKELAERFSLSTKDIDNAVLRVKKKIKKSKGLFFYDEKN